MTFAEWLPWLLFGLLAGALVDRWERRRVMWTVDAFRLVVVGGFAVAVLAGWASIPLLMATGFLLGTGQALVDTASQALVPSLVSRDPGRLARANGRLAGPEGQHLPLGRLLEPEVGEAGVLGHQPMLGEHGPGQADLVRAEALEGMRRLGRLPAAVDPGRGSYGHRAVDITGSADSGQCCVITGDSCSSSAEPRGTEV